MSHSCSFIHSQADYGDGAANCGNKKCLQYLNNCYLLSLDSCFQCLWSYDNGALLNYIIIIIIIIAATFGYLFTTAITITSITKAKPVAVILQALHV